MRLYTTSNATQVDDPVFGTFTAGPSGAFDFPDELSARLHQVHVGKRKQWETDDERVHRIATEELDSVRDPATLLEAVKNIGSGQNLLVAAIAKMLGLDQAGAVPAAAPAEETQTSTDPEAADGEQPPADTEPDGTGAEAETAAGDGDAYVDEAPADAERAPGAKKGNGRR